MKEELIDAFRSLLKDLPLKMPLPLEHIVAPLGDYNLPDSILERCMLYVCKENLCDQNGWFVIQKAKSSQKKYAAYITYNRIFDESWPAQEEKRKLRKAVIVHEFIHFIAFCRQIEFIDEKSEEMMSHLARKFNHVLNVADFAKLFRHQQRNILITEFEAGHYGFGQKDDVDYRLLYEKLLLSDQSIEKYWEEFEKKFPVRKHFENHDIVKCNKWLNSLAVYISDSSLIPEGNVVKRLHAELDPIIRRFYDIDLSGENPSE